MGIITIATVSFAVLIIAIVIMSSIIADQQEKIKRSNQYVKALTAVYEETKKIREKTNVTLKQLDSVDFCIDYLNDNKLRDDSAELNAQIEYYKR